MKEKVLKINKKDYNIAKSLSDRDFGTLVRALCEYVYYGINASPKPRFGVLFSVIAEKVLRIGARSEKQGAAWLLYPDE